MIKSLYELEFEEEEPTLTESTQQEAADRLITLHDDEPEMVARMLLCLYGNGYPIQFKECEFGGHPTVEELMKKGCPEFQTDDFEHETNPLLVHSKLYAIADKYDLTGVQKICLRKFKVNIDDHLELQNLVDALPHVYSSTPPSQTALKQKVAVLVQESYIKVVYNPWLKTDLETAFVENGQLGWDVLSNLFKRRYMCCARCLNRVQFDNCFEFIRNGGACVCGMTQLCGSMSCSNLVEAKWICSVCNRVGLGKVMEKESSLT